MPRESDTTQRRCGVSDCGEGLEVMVDGKWVVTRMEKKWENGRGEWYLVETPYSGDLEYIRARINK